MAQKDIRHNRLNVDRAKQTRRDNDTIQDIEIGLYQIDETIKYYFDNVVKLQVTDSAGLLTKVPVFYGSPENWKSLQASELKRDSRGKILLPFLVYKRDSITKDRDLSNKVDARSPLYYTIGTGLNRHNPNKYDRLTILDKRLIGQKPVKTLQKVIIPDFVTINYSCIVYTEFLTQMNSIIENISYGEGTYFGDKNSFMVKAMINEFPSTVELAIGTDRVVKSEFQITVKGHLIPKNVQTQQVQGSTKTFTKGKVLISETAVNDINSLANMPTPPSNDPVNNESTQQMAEGLDPSNTGNSQQGYET